MSLPDRLRTRIISSATSPFGHADYPLAGTMEHTGDPGLFGPGSVSWRVIGDVSAFAGGIRALLIQAAHPEVVAGVDEHSRYRDDPLGRLSRTSAYVTATTYGARPEVEAAVELVARAHRGVAGRSHRERAYAATNAPHAAWVHNALTDSFLQTYQRFGPDRLTAAEADRFVREQAEIGEMLHAAPVPTTARALATWIGEHPDLTASPGMARAVDFLRDPPLSATQRIGYRMLWSAATETIPPRILAILGVHRPPGAGAVGSSVIRALRWALGSSPSWHLALIRSGAPIPEGRFTQRPAGPIADTRPNVVE